MKKILTAEHLKASLEAAPAEWSRVVSLRAGLRVLPVTLSHEHLLKDDYFALWAFREILFNWAANSTPVSVSLNAIEEATSVANAAFDVAFAGKTNQLINETTDTDSLGSIIASYAAMAALFSRIGEHHKSHLYLRSADHFTTDDLSLSIAWRMLTTDVDWLENQPNSKLAARQITRLDLWSSGEMPASLNAFWASVKQELVARNENYEIWIDWYERRLRGEPAAFDIPGDRYRREDKIILRKLTEASTEEFWGHGAKYVNNTLMEWLNEARERAAKNLKKKLAPSDRAKVAKKLTKAASPQSRVTEGKLDAGPNQAYDQPEYSGNLADLPAELLAFTKVLSASLGPQASDFMRSSLAEYQDEILVRGNRPIVGILKGLASAIGRELWTRESLLASDNPDHWEMRDEREWGTGMADMFRTFFKHHIDLITHFPLDTKREEILKQTPIDEDAATGKSLTEPVELVTQLIRDLHAEGAATDDIIKIMDAHARYNANVAALPPASGESPPTDYVSPKRRHVLMTVGFYHQLYNTLGSTASLTALSITPSLMVQLQAAMEALLNFVI